MEIEDEYELDKNQSTNESKDNSQSLQIYQYSSSPLSKRKYIKKSMQSFIEKVEIEEQDINYQKSNQLQIFPMYETLKEQIEFILIGGDFIYKQQDFKLHNSDVFFKYRDFFNEGYHEQLKQYKDIVSITKSNNFLDVSLVNKRDGLIDFRNLISQISQLLQVISGENYLNLLLQFQEILSQSHEVILHLIQLYPDPQQLLQLQQKRLDYIKNYGKNYLKQHYSDDEFLIIGLTMLDFQRQVPCLRNLAFNQPFASLIGSNFEQLESYFMRKGIKEFFDFKSRVLIQSQHIKEIVEGNGRSIIKSPFNLITYDDIQLQIKSEVETIKVDFPDELKYDKNSGNATETHELGFIMKFILEPEQLQYIINQRNMKLEQQHFDSQELLRREEDICYNMQSQYLIEKFYQQELKTLIKDKNFNYFTLEKCESEEQEENNKEDPDLNQRCKYRLI
ncbi:hypothetical protein ABPG72_001823 [Tetrahymena utriculariae]